ncbi:tRNA uridine-5-carboxymethylaminomethyl(34) synthesis GTPase MnmE [Lentibacter algarum]|uniref:tRNA uridine-5-carboxymethylaminomethyl(34) synthesis GTPase MnmE n=1 Tax=Lentibacter algarum TaxID=576131 RepID=UPI001C06738E|nr:tRNA uridine-5-carboxymethylaminomethyl(34) synthesis GTPase MnmE [Lentibacter algarum]MBU2980329.1 tRNA uridine-5-carboxymethylaminomethyl(34) synthesis GTPase MnmE [Lentibacter algarum]
MSTIFAQATAPGKAGVSVIRVSGPEAFLAAASMCGHLPDPKQSGLRTLRSEKGEILDEALVLCFAEKASFTGEQTVELQLHGSIAIVNAVLAELAKHDGLRLAEPGEFTRRALQNGRLDLAQVEGLADLIESETETQRQQALKLFSGRLSERAEGWREKLIRAASLLEVTIDFADEDVPVDVSPEVISLLDAVEAELTDQINGFGAAERIRTGFEVAIVGAPNVGKSTLLNALAGRDAAITSEIAGTTRDVIEVRMDIAGLSVTLLDTAGIRETADIVERMGVERAQQRAEAADLRVFLIEQGNLPDFKPQKGDVVVTAKADLLENQTGAISGRTGIGLSDLVDSMAARLLEKVSTAGLAARARHKDAMIRAVAAIDRARPHVAPDGEFTDIAAEELRDAVSALNSLIGRVDVENILDEIFSNFCLGK